MAIAILPIFFALIVTFTQKEERTYDKVEVEHASIEEISEDENELYGFDLDSLDVLEEVIRVNQNLGEILNQYHVSPATIARIAQIPQKLFNVRALRADKSYTLITSRDSLSKALGFVYHPNPIEYIVLDFSDSLEVYKGMNPVDTIKHSLGGKISYSLYESLMAQGGSPAIVNQLFDIFAWDIDFWALQPGDTYRILYTTYEVNGEDAGFGKIICASIEHEGKPYYAFGYDQDEGNGWEYFDSHGKSRQGVFLRAPLQYTRISSRFSHSRFHPILKRNRPHYGVDFAAPRGTPVHAIGDGKVEFAGYSGGAGNMVKIRHFEGFVSGYLHLNGYASGIKSGTTVRQGQIIGYVGSTGLSTGPHLDFRIWKNGTPIDPLRLAKPKSGEVCKELMPNFLCRKDILKEKLANIEIEEFSSVALED